MKPLMQNVIGSTWLMSSNSVTILDKNVKKKMHVECVINTIVLKSQQDLFVNNLLWNRVLISCVRTGVAAFRNVGMLHLDNLGSRLAVDTRNLGVIP